MADDFLTIDGTRYAGWGNCPQGQALSASTRILWQSDGSVDGVGWQICTLTLLPGDVSSGTRRIGDNCGDNAGWCQAGLYCDKDDTFSGNDCMRCPCADGVSCGRGSNGDHGAAWPCGSQRGDTQDMAGCDRSDSTSCWECTSHTSSGRGVPCTWNPNTRDCKADGGDWDAGYTHSCEIALRPGDVPPGTNRLGENCGQNDGWCEAGLYCDEDGPSLNECVQCPCPDGNGGYHSCGRGSDGNSSPAWPCGSDGADVQQHILPQIDFLEAFENAGRCIAGPFFGVFHVMGDLLDVLQDADDSQVDQVCSDLVAGVRDSGVGNAVADAATDASCDMDALCATSGPAAPLCEALSMTACVLSGHDVNPCSWILNKAIDSTGDGICGGMRDTLSHVKHGACTTDASFADYARKVTAECCDEASENCEGGMPNLCNAGCSRVMLPMERACSEYLGSHPGLGNLRTTVEAAAAR